MRRKENKKGDEKKMNAKDLFYKVRNDQREIDSLRRRLEAARDLSERCTQALNPAPAKTNVCSSNIENLVVQIVDLERSLQDQLNQSIADKTKASIAINNLKDTDQRIVCEMRFLSGYSLERIQEETGFGETWIRHLINQGCRSADEIIKKYSE